ncbi:MAG: hypothetical protein K9G26_00580 [Emcibacter sp.]|nr:hypothetical protein [Emcibacter sp.]
MADIALGTEIKSGWLRNKQFDLLFVVGTALIALASGAILVLNPKYFGLILFLDLWILGYHHVIATYTRLCFDKSSFQQHRFLIFGLPFLVFLGTFMVATGVGIWTVTSVYLYWQWFHYTRQSWGISQAYRRKSGNGITESETLSKLAFYLLPLWGILYRSWQAPDKFIGAEVKVIPVPEFLVDIVGGMAILTLTLWSIKRVMAFWQGHRPIAHTLYMISHHIIFAAGYILIDDITYGWVVINVWHNAQYLLFVWLFNSNRYRQGIEPSARFLSLISQPNKWWLYFLVCLSITYIAYYTIDAFESSFYLIGIPSLIIIYQTINFHHYVVDSIIWKMRKAPMQKTLNLT